MGWTSWGTRSAWRPSPQKSLWRLLSGAAGGGGHWRSTSAAPPSPSGRRRPCAPALSALPVNGGRLDPDCEVRVTAGPQPQVVEEAMDVSQGKLALGFRTGGITCWEEDYPALVMCNAVFGATPLSKLFLNVREKLSLCYYASSLYHRQKRLITVSSGIEFADYRRAYDEILRQLEAVQKGELEDWELTGAVPRS